MKLDLHVHTSQSDGSFTPEQVIDLAAERGVELLAITDHDVIGGVERAVKAGKEKRIKVIPGIEISSAVSCSGDDIHIVSLNVDINSPKLKKLSNDLTEFKKIKTQKKLDAVNKHFKANITFEDLQKKTEGVPSTGHIGMVLLDKGYVDNIRDGIKPLTKGGPCYVKIDDKLIHAKEAIEIIHEAGGIAILAHLAAYKNEKKFVTFEEQEKLIEELEGYGLDGLEIYIPGLTEEDKEFGLKMAKKYDLIISGGSDFHDEKFIPHSKLGMFDMDKEELTVLKKLVE